MKYGIKICATGQCIVWDTDTCIGCSPGGKNYCDDTNHDKTKLKCDPENAGVSKVNGTYYTICSETCPSCTNYDVVETNMFNGSPTNGPTFDRRICK